MPEQVSRRGSRIEFLDATRAIAAFGVVLYHLYGHNSPATEKWLISRQNLGLFGVYTFFFVSGFIIPVSLQRSRLGQFWRSRLFRLAPAYWFTMALALALCAAGVLQLEPAFHGFHWKPLLLNAFMVAPLVRQPVILGTFWTLSIELLFYVLCCALKITGLLSHRLGIAYAAVGIYIAGLLAAKWHLIPLILFRGEWLALLLAAYVGGVFYEVQQERLRARQLIPLVALFLIVVLFGMRFDYAPGHHPPSELTFAALYMSWLEATAFFCLMFALRSRQFPLPLLWLGRISYSLYLMHDVVGLLSGHVRGLPPFVISTLALAMSILVADLCYRFVERPALHLAKGRHLKDPTNPTQPVLAG